MKIEAVVFDVNGTVLDMAALDRDFARIFGSGRFREKWFDELRGMWMTVMALGKFEAFEKLAEGALRMVAAREGVALKKPDAEGVMEKMQKLPAFGDVAEGLKRLRAAGYRVVASTNGSRKGAKAQLKNAGLSELFDEVFGADQVRRFKPAEEVYAFAGKELGVSMKRMVMVAAHGWDLEGARAAGMRTAFVARPRMVLNPEAEAPDFVVRDVGELAGELGAGTP